VALISGDNYTDRVHELTVAF